MSVIRCIVKGKVVQRVTGRNGKKSWNDIRGTRSQDGEMKKKAKEELDEWGERQEKQREKW